MGRSGDEFLSPDIQIGAMRQLIGMAGMREVEVVDDIDVSGTHFSRRGIERIRALVQQGAIDAIAIYDVSRLGRNVGESLRFLDWVKQHGVRIVSANEQMDTSTPVGRLMWTNMMAIAEYRANEIGRNWSATIEHRARAGKHHGRPYGYRRVHKALVPDPHTGPLVSYAFTAYAAGVPISTIAREVAARRGRRISTNAIKAWLRNPVYLGHVTAAGEIVMRDAHPPLVEQDVWDQVRDRLARDATAPARHLAPTWALVGLTYGDCGHRLQRMPTKYRGPVDRLVCGMGPSRGMGGRCVGIGSPRMEPVQDEVLRQVQVHMELLRSDHATRARRMSRRAQAGVDRAEAERELARLRAAMAKLAKSWALGDVPDGGYHDAMGELRAAEGTWQQRLAAGAGPAVMALPDESAAAAQALLRLWPRATSAERNRMLRTVVSRVVVARAAFWRQPEWDRVSVSFL